MDDELRKELLAILIKAISAFSSKDSQRLKAVSDEAIRNCAIHQDPHSINLAIIVYSLAKVVERQGMYKKPQWSQFFTLGLDSLKQAERFLEEEKEKQYLKSIQDVLYAVASLESYLRKFITEVITQARIKRGSAIYEQGLSLGRVAELMGISPWELMEYLGQRRVEDTNPLSTMPIDERMKMVRKVFQE